MFIDRKYNPYTNYNVYACDKRAAMHEVESDRLIKVIEQMIKKYKHPYLRFMWVVNSQEAMCVAYSNYKKNERLTKLVPFKTVESLIME